MNAYNVQEKMGSLPSGVPKERVQISVALAPPSGSAPGPPATLEILPAGHCSAPHDNANTFGVLRVLRGLLDGEGLPQAVPGQTISTFCFDWSGAAVALYDCELGEADEYAPLDEVEMDLNDAMWFSPSWYQTVRRESLACKKATLVHATSWQPLAVEWSSLLG